MKSLVFVLGLLISSISFAAEDFTLWDSATFDAPYTDGLVARSSFINNNNGLNSVKISIVYEVISPKPCSCQLVAVVEEEIVSGVWIALGAQHEVISSDDNAPTRIINIAPHFVANPGADEFIAVGQGIRVSSTDASVGDRFRVSVYNRDTGATGLLQSVTITANGRKYSM